MSVKFGILALLERNPAYGYQLKREFEASTGGRWPVNVGQVYTTLERLERDGLVRRSGEGADGQVVYSITTEGQSDVAEWLTTASLSPSADRNELAVKIALASLLPSVDIHAVIQTHRKAALAAMHSVTVAKRADANDLLGELVLEAIAFRSEAEVRWLDHAETRILQARRTADAAATSAEEAQS
jgi:DNA-binding PadR family transcriptional regulator